MGQKQIFSSSVYDQMPPLSANHHWIVAQNLDAEDEAEVQIFFSIHDPLRHYRCRIPELLGKHVRGCFYGWVILSDHPHNVKWSLWNPVTSKVINLPRLIYKQSDSDDDDIDYCCLPLPPDDPNSVLLMTRAQKPHFVFCRLHPKKKKRWTEMSYAKQVKKLTGKDGFLTTPTCCNGKVYASPLDSFLVVELSIVVRDTGVVINLSSLLSFPNHSPMSPMWYSYLVATCKDLLIIYLDFDKVTGTFCDVNLFKVDTDSKTCEELEDLKEATIFLDINDHCLYPQCHSLAIGSELGGYLHFLSENRSIIYSYHVKDKTISLSYVPCLVGTSYVSNWAMLECKRLLEGDHKQEEDKKGKMVVPGSSNANLLKREGFTWLESVWRWVKTPWIIRLMWLKPWLPKKKKVKSDEVEFIGTTDESHLLNLPFDVLEMIIGLCVGVEYINFRASCKLCYLAAPIIQWSNQTASKRLQLQQYSLVSPWLMVLGKHTITHFDPMFGDKYFMKTPQEFGLVSELRLHCSRHGWLLMEKYHGQIFFFNPFTSDTRKLPFVHYHLDRFDFSAPPSSPDCVVVGFCEGIVCIHFVGRESFWREYSINLDNNDPDLYRFPAFYGVDVYTLHYGKGVDVFEFEDHNCKWTRVLDEVPISSSTSKAQHFLVKCNHEYICDEPLMLVIVGEFGESVEVFILNEDEDAGKWDKIDDIGRHMIYIDNKTCLCMEAKTPKMENKIYFPRLHAGKIVFYSLETGKFHTFNGGNISESFTDLSGTINHVPHNAWIEPVWSS